MLQGRRVACSEPIGPCQHSPHRDPEEHRRAVEMTGGVPSPTQPTPIQPRTPAQGRGLSHITVSSPQGNHRPRPPCQGDAVSLAAARSASPRFPVSEQATTTSRERHSTAGSGQPGPPTCLCRTARAAVTWASRRPPPPPPWQNGGARRPAVTATTLLFPRGFEARTRSLCAMSSWSLSSTLCGAVVG